MAELKKCGREKDSKQTKPRLGDILDNRGKLTRQLRDANIGSSDKIDWTEVKRLVTLGADPNGLIGLHTPLLIHAANEGNVEVCKFLLDNGADANFQMKHNGQTPLMFAACRIHGNVACAIFDMLFEHGADISLRDSNGKDAIQWVAETRKLVAGSYMNRKERNGLLYLVDIVISKMLAERSDTFFQEFRECIKR
jgi:ankyrin repeat protein